MTRAIYKGCQISCTRLGLEISRRNEYGRNVYLSKIYNGKATWVTDYLYSKKFKTLSGAKGAIESIKNDANKEV